MISKKIKQMLQEYFNVHTIQIEDESSKHKGHSQSTGGHFKLNIISNDFLNKTLIERHRMIYKVLEPMMKKEIHALSIQARTEKEIYI